MRSTIASLALLFIAGACNFPTETPAEATPAASVVAEQLSPTFTAEPEPPPTTTPAVEPTALPPTAPPPSLRVAFSSDGNLWSAVAGDSPSQLNSAGSVAEIRITDDGERIAYVLRDPQENTAELRCVAFDGSDDRLLLGQAAIDAFYPLEAFSHYTLAQMEYLPGTHSLLFNTRGVFEGPGLANNDDLLAIDVDTGELTTVLPPDQGGNFVIAPGGSQIAIVRPDSVGFANSDGSNLRPEVLSFPRVNTFSEFFFYPIPVWTEGGVLVPIPQENPFLTPLTGVVWEVPASGGEPRVVVSVTGDLFRPQAQAPLISSDGAIIAFLAEADTPNEQRLMLLNPLSGEQTAADSGIIHWDGWSPDPSQYTYARGSGLDLQLGTAGAEPTPIGSGTGLRWVDATQYLYLAGSPGSWTLTLSDLAGDSTVLAAPAGEFVAYDFAG